MTIKEIASIAGVSISTVSKIVNNKATNINPETRERVLKVVKEYNYTPYGTVLMTSSAKKFVIGILSPYISGSPEILKGILSYASSHGYGILVYDKNDSPENELKNLNALYKNNIDALLWEPVFEENLDQADVIAKYGIDIFYVKNPYRSASCSIDYFEAGYQMTDLLIQNRHSNILFFQSKNPLLEDSLNGFKQCLLDHNRACSEGMVIPFSKKAPLKHILSGNYTAFVCPDPKDAIAFYEAMHKLKYQFPRDFSLITLSGQDYAIPYRISHLEIPYHAFGEHICKQIIEKCEHPGYSYRAFEHSMSFSKMDTIDLPMQLKKPQIVVVGSINMDITLNVHSLPLSGNTIVSNSSSIYVGGKGCNQAVGVSRLRNEVNLIGKIGNDIDASLILNALEKERINTHGIHRDNSNVTGKAYIHVQPDAESTITILTGANHTLSVEDIMTQEQLFMNTAYCLLTTESPIDALAAAAELAHKYHAKTILKPAALNDLPENLMKHVDILIPNQMEADALCPDIRDLEQQADYLVNTGIEAVIITLGQRGCYLHTETLSRYFPAANFSPVDNTGAADAFIAALASYLTDGHSLEHAIQIATYAAGFCISQRGVYNALVDRDTLEQYLMQHNPNLLGSLSS